MSNDSSLQIIETAYGRIEKHPDDIVCLYLTDNMQVDKPLAELMVTQVRSLMQSDQIRLMIVYGVDCDIAFSAQRYFASVTGFTHVAFVVHTNAQAQVGQFLVSIFRSFKSMYEFRLFYETKTALAWLRQQ